MLLPLPLDLDGRKVSISGKRPDRKKDLDLRPRRKFGAELGITGRGDGAIWRDHAGCGVSGIKCLQSQVQLGSGVRGTTQPAAETGELSFGVRRGMHPAWCRLVKFKCPFSRSSLCFNHLASLSVTTVDLFQLCVTHQGLLCGLRQWPMT